MNTLVVVLMLLGAVQSLLRCSRGQSPVGVALLVFAVAALYLVVEKTIMP